MRIGFDDIDDVVSGVEAGEEILAGGVSAGGSEEDINRVDETVVVEVGVEEDVDVRKKGFGGINEAVCVGVDPEGVADFGNGRAKGGGGRRPKSAALY